MKLKDIIGSMASKFAALALVCGFAAAALATPVAKVDSTEYETISEAIAAWGPGKTLTLLADVEYASTVNMEIYRSNADSSKNGDWTLNLGDHKWTAVECNAFKMSVGDDCQHSTGFIINANSDGGIVAGSGRNCIDCEYMTQPNTYRPRVNISGGSYTGSQIINYWSLSSNSSTKGNGPTVAIKRSSGDNTEPVFNGNFALAKCKITVDAGYFNGTNFNTYPVGTTADTTINGGTFKNLDALPSANNNKGIIFGSGVVIYVDEEGKFHAVQSSAVPSEYEAKTPKFSNIGLWPVHYRFEKYTQDFYWADADTAIANFSSLYTKKVTLSAGVTATRSLSISSSTYTIDATASGASYTGNITLSNSSAKFVVKFSSDTEADAGYYGTVSAASGKYIHIDETTEVGVVTRTYSVKSNSSSGTQNSQAKVGDLYYDTVYDAFFAVDGNTEGKTITLLKDVSNAGILTNGKAVNEAGKTVVTFDLNGHSFGLQSAGTGNDADYELTVVDSSEEKTGKVTNTKFSLLKIALTGTGDYSGKYTLIVKGGKWRFNPEAIEYDGNTYDCVPNGFEVTTVVEDDITWYMVGEVPPPVATIDDKTYDTIEAVIEDVADSTPVEITADTTIGTATIEAGSTVTTTSGTASEATATPQGGGDPVTTTVTPKTVTIEKTGDETKTVAAYVVSQGSGESARQSVVTDVAKDETVVSTDANKTDVSDFVDVGKVLANAVADNDIDASTVTSMELSLSKTEKEGTEEGLSAALVAAIESATKAFEVHPVATITTTTTEGNTTTTDTATYEVQNAELAADASFTFTLDFGVGNAGKAVTLTHYASDGTQKGDSWVETVGADGLVSVTLKSFSYLLGTVAETSYYVTTVNGRYEVTTTAPAGTPTAYASEEDAVAAYQASAVAKIGSAYYATLQAAISAAQDGDTIEFLSDIVWDSSNSAYYEFNVPGSVTIDGKGYTLSAPATGGPTDSAIMLGDSSSSGSSSVYTITNVTFSWFTSISHSVLRAQGVTAKVVDCTFAGNASSGEEWGVVTANNGANVTVKGCTFRGNAGMKCVDVGFNVAAGSSMAVDNCLFEDNILTGHGVIYVASGVTSASIQNCTFTNNAVTASGAAVVYCSGTTTIAGNLFADNRVTSSGKEGVIVLGSGATGTVVGGNAFVDNELGNAASHYATVYTGSNCNLAGNYWGEGAAPEVEDHADVYASGELAIDTATFASAYAVNENGRGVTVTIASPVVTFLLRDEVGDMTIQYDSSVYTIHTQDGVQRSGAAVYNYMTQTVANGDPATEPAGEPSYWYHSGKTFPAGNNTGIPFTVDDSRAYVFDGWRLSGQNVRYDFSTPVTSDITLVPHFSALEEVFAIYTEADLFAFAREVTLGRSYRSKVGGAPRQTVKLMNNITLTSNWTPIPGNFHGIFDGNGYAISGLVINDTNNETGFFRTSGNGGSSFEIKDLTFQNPQVTSSGCHVGVLAGKMDSATVTNVTINNPTVLCTSTDNVGGLVGSVNNNVGDNAASGSTFSGCSVNGGTISCTGSDGRMVGGLIGQGVRYLTITDCSVSNVTINGYRKLGGLIGQANGAHLTCTDASVSGVTLNALGNTSYANNLTMGGLVGQFATPTQSTITGTVSDITMTGPESIASGKNYVMGWVSGGTAGTVEAAETAMTGASMTFDVTVSGTNTRTISNDSTYAGINGGEPVVYVASITRGGVTTEYTSAQEALDQVVSGDTLTLYAGDHGTLYIRQNPDISVIVDVVGKDGDGEGAPRGNDRYRAFANVTIVGASGATLNKIVVESGTNSSVNPSSNPDYTNLDSLIEIDNLTISGLIFNLQANGPAIDLRQTYHFRLTGLTIDGCTVNGTESFGDSERLLYGVIASNARVSQNRPQFTAVEKKDVNYTTGLSNLVVTDCTFNNLHQVMEVRNVTNLTFTGNTVNGVRKHTIIALKDTQNPVALMGTVTIANNTIDGTSGDRVFRMDYANATVAITGNTITDYSASDADFIKISNSGNDASYTITGNTITGTTGGLCVNCDKEPGSTDLVAKIGTKYYKTLADAIAAVPTTGAETTITMIANSAEPAVITVASGKNVVLDLNGKTVSYTTDAKSVYFLTNEGMLTIKDNSANADGQVLLTAQVDNGYSVENVTLLNEGGELTLESGTVKNLTPGGLTYAVKNSSNAWASNVVSTFNMTGGVISAPSGDAALRVYQNTGVGWKVQSKNYVNISGGTILDTGIFFDTYLYTVNQTLPADFAANDTAVGCDIDTVVNISGGTINGLIDMKIRHPYNTRLNITGGDFANCKMWVRKVSNEYGSGLASGTLSEPTEPMVYISGGKFAFVTGKAFGLSYDCGATSWTTYEKPYAVSGGVFSSEVPANYCAEGYEPADNTDAETKEAYPYTVGKQLAVVDAATGKAEMSKALDGYKFKMAVSQNGRDAAEKNVDTPVIPDTDLPASGEYATYAFTAVKTADGSETAVQNTVGILRVADAVASTNTIIAVPWQAFGDKIAIGSLVYLGNREAGDQLMAYDAASGTYYSWTLEVEGSAKTWKPDTTVKTGSEKADEARAASEFEISRGQGVFLVRKDPSKPIYLVGRAPNDGETVAAPTTLAAGSKEKPTWSLVAAPSTAPLDLNASGSRFGAENADDTIMLVSAGGVAMKIPYTYKDGKWGRPVSKTVTETRANGTPVTYTYTERRTDGCTIPAGTGFWYLNKGGVKTVEW